MNPSTNLNNRISISILNNSKILDILDVITVYKVRTIIIKHRKKDWLDRSSNIYDIIRVSLKMMKQKNKKRV